MKQHVRLETAHGELVAEKDMPQFTTPPEVIVWGTRTFKHFDDADDCLIYRECFAFFVQ